MKIVGTKHDDCHPKAYTYFQSQCDVSLQQTSSSHHGTVWVLPQDSGELPTMCRVVATARSWQALHTVVLTLTSMISQNRCRGLNSAAQRRHLAWKQSLQM